jgi:hypothetical protein
MTNIVDLTERLPHITGEAICTLCGCLWVACSPAGVALVECPDCGTPTGRRLYGVAPSNGVVRRECQCGCQLFHLLMDPLSLLCHNCGLTLPVLPADYDEDDEDFQNDP